MPPVLWIGLSSWRRHVAVEVRQVAVSARFSASVSPGHRQAVAVQQPGVEQRLHDHRDAADPVDVVHHEPAERLQVGEVRDLGRRSG